jgi:GYF domain 2
MRQAGGEKIEDALWLIKTGDSEVGPVSTDEMVAMIEAGEVSARTLVKTVAGQEAWQRTDTTSLIRMARLGPRTASKLACFSAGVVLAGLAALASIHPASAQSRSGTTSPNYCGTAAVEDLARLIGGRVGTVAGNGSTEFEAPEIPAGDTISVRCGSAPQTYGIYSRHDWTPAFLNAFLAIAEKSVGRPKLELSKAMAECRRLAFRPFNRNSGFGFSKETDSGKAEVKTRWFVLECNFENDPIYSRYGFTPPTSRN